MHWLMVFADLLNQNMFGARPNIVPINTFTRVSARAKRASANASHCIDIILIESMCVYGKRGLSELITTNICHMYICQPSTLRLHPTLHLLRISRIIVRKKALSLLSKNTCVCVCTLHGSVVDYIFILQPADIKNRCADESTRPLNTSLYALNCNLIVILVRKKQRKDLNKRLLKAYRRTI